MSRARFYDVSTDPAGRPLTGVTVTVYTTGTTTLLPATIYAAASGAATRANPFVTSTGVVDFWLEDPAVVDVKYTLAGYGTQTQTVEVVEATPPATAVTVTPVGGLSSTTAQAALAELDADLTAHGGATSAVHGIPDTTLLATDAEVATAVGAHDVAPAAHSGTTVAPKIICPIIATEVNATAAHPLTTFGTFSRFTLVTPTTLRWVRYKVGIQSGNIQLAIARIAETRGAAYNANFTYTRVMNSGIIACPAAGSIIQDLGATLLPAGDYFVWQWLSDTTATVIHGGGQNENRCQGGSAQLVGGLAASGSISWGDRYNGCAIEQAT